jgi:hypothetical protein
VADSGGNPPGQAQPAMDALAIGLSVAVGICGAIFAAVLVSILRISNLLYTS